MKISIPMRVRERADGDAGEQQAEGGSSWRRGHAGWHCRSPPERCDGRPNCARPKGGHRHDPRRSRTTAPPPARRRRRYTTLGSASGWWKALAVTVSATAVPAPTAWRGRAGQAHIGTTTASRVSPAAPPLSQPARMDATVQVPPAPGLWQATQAAPASSTIATLIAIAARADRFASTDDGAWAAGGVTVRSSLRSRGEQAKGADRVPDRSPLPGHAPRAGSAARGQADRRPRPG